MLIFSPPPPQMFVFVIDISDCCKSHHPGDEPLLLLGDWQLASAAAGGRGHGRHLVHLLNNRFCTSGLVLGNVVAALRALEASDLNNPQHFTTNQLSTVNLI